MKLGESRQVIALPCQALRVNKVPLGLGELALHQRRDKAQLVERRDLHGKVAVLLSIVVHVVIVLHGTRYVVPKGEGTAHPLVGPSRQPQLLRGLQDLQCPGVVTDRLGGGVGTSCPVAGLDQVRERPRFLPRLDVVAGDLRDPVGVRLLQAFRDAPV